MTLDEIHTKLSGIPTLQELCALPVSRIWYPLGLWLGVNQAVLQNIKKSEYSLSEESISEEKKEMETLNAIHVMFRLADTTSLFSSDDEDCASETSVDETELSEDETVEYLQQREMFKEFLEVELSTEKVIKDLSPKENRLFVYLLHEVDSYQAVKWCKFLSKLSISKRRFTQKVLKQKWIKRAMIIEALVKVGYREVAEKYCSQKGKLDKIY